MRHINEQVGAHCICDLPKLRPIHHPAVCRKACDDELGLVLLRQRHDVLVIHQALVVDAVLNRVVNFAGEIHRRAMGQVTTISKTHPQHRIAGLEQSVVNRDIGT